MQVEGVVERIVFFNDETFFCVASMRPSSAGFSRVPVTITGVMPSIQCGETIFVKGRWTNNSKFGRQIKVDSFESRLPSEIYGLEKFLGSGLVEGIGPVYAKRIVEKFGARTLEVIDTESARLLEVDGIGKGRLAKIRGSWAEQKQLRDVVIAMRAYGVGMAVCVRIIRRFGADALRVAKTEPYRLAREIDGIGFKTADAVALNMGVPNESEDRREAGIMHLLSDAETEGHTCVPTGALCSESADLLKVDSKLCFASVDALAARGEVVSVGNGLIQSRALDFCERRIVANLSRLVRARSDLPPIKRGLAVEWAKKRAGIDFALEQSNAIVCALENKVCVITGGPGTGKTTILRALCHILKAKKSPPLLAAPTGRAAQRMGESCGMEAKTVHRLLGFNREGNFLHGEGNPLDAPFIVLDEASMLDTRLAAAVFAAVPDGAHLLLVGDADQLPSVGSGNVLGDIISSSKIPVARLSKIFRQAEGSEIILAAHALLGGESSPALEPRRLEDADYERDVNFVLAPDPGECARACVELVSKLIPKHCGFDPFDDIQVLSPTHRGDAGTGKLNVLLKEALNPKPAAVSYAGTSFSVGDKVMQTRNNYELDIFNGDMGRVRAVSSDLSEMSVDFDGRTVSVPKKDLCDFQTAYAVSVHKSQGSEFPAVVVPVLRQHYIMLRRNLFYTALTRGRKKVFIVGDPSAWNTALRNGGASERRTFLGRRLKEAAWK